jgi:hydrophobe/amphiphile efflux-1 (HAE1) family protein
MWAKFFIDHPRFAMVISIVMALAGAISITQLPVAQYPDVTPPQIRVSATFRGANAQTVAKTVGAPLEEAINGVDGMIYMNSTSSNNGSYQLFVTFKIGTNPDMALVKVQNRVQQAQPQLPSEVTANGITVRTAFSDTLGMVAITSPHGSYNNLQLMDYAYRNVKNVLSRVPGMGDVNVFGGRYSIRVWLDPDRMASLGLSISDVSSAIQSQNKQASIGSIGAAPTDASQPLMYTLTAKGRLSNVSDFENIIVRTSDGGMVKLSDIARIELGSENYSYSNMLNGEQAAMISMTQSSGSNALTVMSGAKEVLATLSKSLPNDMKFVLGYDSTEYVKETIKEILSTLILTFLLVVFVCWLFLQDWKVTLVPVAAIPVSLLATFAGLAFMGYSINILSLFGLVLVIGTVVDDAIVVVERVTFLMDRDHTDPKTATLQAMKDITGPMVATTLVFLAIFVPVAFMSGITGQIYRQFAVTISISVMCSLVFALTMSPAMCAHLFTRIHKVKHGPLAWFNTGLAKTTKFYVDKSTWIARRRWLTASLVCIVIGLCIFVIKVSPTAFIPDEDQGTIFVSVQLPEGSAKERTFTLLNQMAAQMKKVPGVKLTMGITGFNIVGSSGENTGSIIVPLDPWGQRKTADKSLQSIVGKIRGIAASFPEAKINVITPPAISGLGVSGGIDLRLQQVDGDDPTQLAQVMNGMLMKLNQAPEFQYAFSTYTSNTPHLYVDIDREKAQMMNVPVSTIFSTMQMYFGSSYINDINLGSQVNKVMVESDWNYRNKIDKIGSIFVTSSTGQQVPLETLIKVTKILAPNTINRYNLYPSAGITLVMKQGYSTGQGMKRIAELAKRSAGGLRL